MANLDLMSYERDSRWQPHLSWAYPDTTFQQRMQQQAAEREQAWQRIADKLGPLLIGSDIGGSYGQSDYISRDICEDQDYQERAYEKAPLLSSAKYPSSKSAGNHKDTTSTSRSINSNTNNNNHLDSDLNNISRGNKQLTSQRNSNLNLYAQQHYVQMPQRGNLINPQNHLSKQQNFHHNSSGGYQLFLRLSVLLPLSLLLLASLLLYFFYFNK